MCVWGLFNPHKKPLKLPAFLSSCPLSNLLHPQRGISHGGEDPQRLHSLPQESPTLFLCLLWAAAAPRRPIFCPPARVGPGSSCSLVPGGVKASRRGQSEQSVVASPRGNEWRFLLPYPTPQESGVTSFPPGEDCTAVLPWGSPAPKNLPCCSSTSKGFTPHEEQRIWEPAVPGSESSLKIPEG